MITRSQVDTFKPNPQFHGHTSHISPILKSPFVALSDPHWRDAMYDEYNTLIKNSYWILVPKPLNVNVVRSMWLLRHKYHADGSVSGLAGGLQYLTFTRPDSSYVVQQICLHIQDPREPHLASLKRVLRYIRGTLDHGLQLHVSSTSQLNAYTDADWASCPVTRRSTSGHCVFLRDNLLSWSAKRQVTLSRSSAEAEYRRVANVVAETAWIRNLLRELHNLLFTVILVYCDNIRVLHVSSRYQYADIFTKGLPTAVFEEFRTFLVVRSSPAQTAGEC
nr:ribonuclease H-like domain-containing protein [Tanacetum cinerariifolium]